MRKCVDLPSSSQLQNLVTWCRSLITVLHTVLEVTENQFWVVVFSILLVSIPAPVGYQIRSHHRLIWILHSIVPVQNPGHCSFESSGVACLKTALCSTWEQEKLPFAELGCWFVSLNTGLASALWGFRGDNPSPAKRDLLLHAEQVLCC